MARDTKIDDVAERIREMEARAAKMPSIGSGEPIPPSRVGMDFAMSVLGGALLGWLADMAVPSIAPWPLIGLVIAGFLSGVLNAWRSFAAPGADKQGG